MLARAGERAESLAAAAEASRYFEQAAELTAAPKDRARLLGRAGDLAYSAGDPEGARRLLEGSMALHESEEGDLHAAARASMELARVEAATGERAQAIVRGERALAALSSEEEPTRTSRCSPHAWQSHTGSKATSTTRASERGARPRRRGGARLPRGGRPRTSGAGLDRRQPGHSRRHAGSSSKGSRLRSRTTSSRRPASDTSSSRTTASVRSLRRLARLPRRVARPRSQDR